jgi:hypothetical protein
MNCWETFFIHQFRHQNTLITEQQMHDVNPLYAVADPPPIPQYKT